MDAARWDRIQNLFHEAALLPAAEWRAWLESQSDEPALVADVLAMLGADARTGSLLDRDMGAIAQRIVAARGPVPERIGAYRIIGVAGEGGMGVVYLAERADLGSRAAVKVLRDAPLSPLRRERFASEQRLLAQLDHPFIARLYDADVLPDGTPYFIMEYVDGVSLTTYAQSERLHMRERLELFCDVCAGVQYAHAAAVIHRDLKPSNILVRQDGVVKLLDFGIARQLESLDGTADPTLTAVRMMTPAYAAPEQLSGGAIGTYTDVYSLGVILYELLTGRPPYDPAGLTPGQLERVILQDEPERPSQAVRRTAREADPGPDAAANTAANAAATVAPDAAAKVAPDAAAKVAPNAAQIGASAWHDLDVLCQTAMHKDPARRYRTVEALVRDVQHFLAQEPLEARPDSTRYRVDRFLRRNWRPSLATAAAIAAVLGLTLFYTARLAAARDAALVEAERAQQIHRFVVNLFQGGDEEVGPADSLRVVSLLDRGVRDARMLEGDARMQTELYATLGSIYVQLGNFTRADSLLQLALGQRRRLFGTEHAEVATSLVALGALRAEQAELDEAERLAREGLLMSRRTLPPGDPRIGAAAATLGEVLQARGEHDEAIALLEEAIRLEDGRASPQLASQISTLAATHYYAGNYAASDSLNRRSLALNQQIFGPRHPHVADDLINLGAVRFEMGDYEETEALYRAALAIKLEYYGDDHHRTAANRTVLGRALVALQRYEDALEQLVPALQVRERVFGPEHPAVASTLNEIGSVASAREDYALAEASYQRMLAIYQVIYDGPHSFIGVALSNLGSLYMNTSQHARAEEVLARSVEQFTRALSAEHTNTAIARIKLARAMRLQNRCTDALPHFHAGYDILSRQVDPGISFLQAARGDLALCYEALGSPAEATRWRTEHARYLQPPAGGG
jgi:eukaryotic-like serine/threonine-protein kinase